MTETQEILQRKKLKNLLIKKQGLEQNQEAHTHQGKF